MLNRLILFEIFRFCLCTINANHFGLIRSILDGNAIFVVVDIFVVCNRKKFFVEVTGSLFCILNRLSFLFCLSFNCKIYNHICFLR